MSTEWKKVYVAWTNSDTTEGRGRRIPLYVCRLRPTAERWGRSKGVQGSDCEVTEEKVVLINRHWYGPVDIREPSAEDIRINTKRNEKDAVLQKAKDLGLSDKDIEILRKGEL